jgi:Family of unknown function (DUF7003)
VVEVFGHSPRSGVPDTPIYTFASTLYNRDLPETHANWKAYENYLANHPHNEWRFVYPNGQHNWKSPESDGEFIAENSTEIQVRNRLLQLPPLEEYGRHGIELQASPRVRVFELCRFIADMREQVLATPPQRCISILPHMKQVLQLEEWNHPNTADGDLPSQSQRFSNCLSRRPRHLPWATS